MATPPSLPSRFTDIRTVVAIGTCLWGLAAVALGIGWLLGVLPAAGLVTCVAGMLLGGVGLGIHGWQRAAARRGSRTAQQGVE